MFVGRGVECCEKVTFHTHTGKENFHISSTFKRFIDTNSPLILYELLRIATHIYTTCTYNLCLHLVH